MSLVQFNVNESVFVKLKPEGIAILREYELPTQKMFPSHPGQQPEENGYFRFPMWQFMQLFGPSIDMGFFPVFETTILIDESDLKKVEE